MLPSISHTYLLDMGLSRRETRDERERHDDAMRPARD
jgi:hypothetical protein